MNIWPWLLSKVVLYLFCFRTNAIINMNHFRLQSTQPFIYQAEAQFPCQDQTGHIESQSQSIQKLEKVEASLLVRKLPTRYGIDNHLENAYPHAITIRVPKFV